MKKNVFAIYNKKVSCYNPPVIAIENKEQYLVSIERYCILNRDEAKKAHFDECELYYLGEWDETTCEFVLLVKPEFVGGFDAYFKE